jgi:hypothetical protein
MQAPVPSLLLVQKTVKRSEFCCSDLRIFGQKRSKNNNEAMCSRDLLDCGISSWWFVALLPEALA